VSFALHCRRGEDHREELDTPGLAIRTRTSPVE
jgi:hypothetical protein